MDGVTDWDIDAQQALQPELMNGESLLWSGRPLRRIIFHRLDWFAIPFSLFWGGFSLFWTWGAAGSGHGSPNIFGIFGIPFVLIGQYMIWGRFLYEAWKKGRVSYGVTNRRVLVLIQGSSRKLIEGSLRTLDSLDLTVRQDGAGTISFIGPPVLAWTAQTRRGNGTNIGLQLESLTFFDISNARRVYELIRDSRG